MEITYWLSYLGIGALAGFLAGLIGIGGGVVMVPAFTLMWLGRGMDPAHVLHLAVGTSMAVILVNSLASLRTHHQHGAVNWTIVRNMVPGIVVGGVTGTLLAYLMAADVLKYFFLGFMLMIAVQLLADVQPKPHRTLPGKTAQSLIGAGFSCLSNLAGVGGAMPFIAVLTWCNVRLQEAIGTAAALVFPIAVAGTAGYLVTGSLVTGLPEYSLGYVYLPAWFAVSLGSLVFAPVGAKLTHTLPTKVLKRVFTVFFLIVAVKMVVSL